MSQTWKIGNPGCPCCCPEHVCGVVSGCGARISGVTITVTQGGTTIGSGTTGADGQVCIEVPSTGTYTVSCGTVSGYAAPSNQTVTVSSTCGMATATFDLTPNTPRQVCIRVYGCNSPLPRTFGGSLDGYWIDLDGNIAIPTVPLGGGPAQAYPPGHPGPVAFISGQFPAPFGNPLPGATVTIGTNTGTSDSNGEFCAYVTGPGTITITVTFPYGYQSVSYTRALDGCHDDHESVILYLLPTHVCCPGAPADWPIPKSLNLSDGFTTISFDYGSAGPWEGCDGSFPSSNPECVAGSHTGAVHGISGTVPLRFTMGCVSDAYGQFIGLSLCLNWPFFRFVAAADITPLGGGNFAYANCVFYNLPLACGWTLSDLLAYGGDWCNSCRDFGVCNSYGGGNGVACVFIPKASITINPFDFTATLPGTGSPPCSDGSGGAPNPVTTPVTVSA